jgi:hypothetical protein
VGVVVVVVLCVIIVARAVRDDFPAVRDGELEVLDVKVGRQVARWRWSEGYKPRGAESNRENGPKRRWRWRRRSRSRMGTCRLIFVRNTLNALFMLPSAAAPPPNQRPPNAHQHYARDAAATDRRPQGEEGKRGIGGGSCYSHWSPRFIVLRECDFKR